MHDPIPTKIEDVAKDIVHSCFLVHKALGPGLLESVYETCVAHELKKLGRRVERQVQLPVVYDGIRVEGGLRIDMMVDEEVVVELKAVDALPPVAEAQVLTYLKLANKRLGLLVNFNVPVLKAGIKRFVI